MCCADGVADAFFVLFERGASIKEGAVLGNRPRPGSIGVVDCAIFGSGGWGGGFVAHT